MNQIKPLNSDVLLKQLPPPPKTDGGILLPDYVDSHRNYHEVVSVGPKVQDVRIGDKVLLGDKGGINVQYGDVQYVHIAEAEILAVL